MTEHQGGSASGSASGSVASGSVAPVPGRWFVVVRPGPLTTIQDTGRRGVAALGVPRAGALDGPAFRWANTLVGNRDGDAGGHAGVVAAQAAGGRTGDSPDTAAGSHPGSGAGGSLGDSPDTAAGGHPGSGAGGRAGGGRTGIAPGAAVLEATFGGLALRLVGGAAWIAVTGAPTPVHVDGRAVAFSAPVRVREGALVEIGRPVAGVRCYLAVDGGFAVPRVLGSRSTDLLAGLGPDQLHAGTRLPLGPPRRLDSLGQGADGSPLAAPPRELLLRLTPGPRRDWFEPESLAALARTPYRVSPASNRIGLRLTDGPPLRRLAGLGELPSEGMVLGAVQVPPDGMPVVFLADHPTTGGYPVVGVVPEADLAAAAQAAPGTPVRLLPTARLEP
ncbi:biotin-dependent carboxyltransferase family protein [Streptacidiphilus jiangxiensis]|uniref:Biotin-dependent carboxylase uncharacterized domain-containing protein n=1 Tax=Streptacidiphilus jiangxiensis TaxID=235985 RepID=A0A1H7UC57_STRJI|nr:biotin-dependent carboxyltransferase family protein [Streptacidiphilus jiangxiensis]SEL94551.1 biotin-dependent carboxylase uncharacterized domain-containing protein [Streptacidiphilus jiangxiensis]